MSRILLALGICFVLFCCKKPSQDYGRSPVNAFYYWQTSISSMPWHDSVYQAMNVQKLYMRFFDIDWSEEVNGPVPVAPVSFGYYYDWDTAVAVVPVVFITNETFKNISLQECPDLAKHVHRRVMTQLNLLLRRSATINLYNESWVGDADPFRMKSAKFDEQKKYDSLNALNVMKFGEVQFDCDWTSTTKEKYFAFLAAAKESLKGVSVTSTLRLYQYKYPDDAGVPPVSRAMLMCYNAGDMKSKDTKNSIFDSKEIMSYVDGVKPYPIPLDYALPIFSWALVYHDNRLTHILPSTTIIQDYAYNLTPGGPDHFYVKDDFVVGFTARSVYLRRGDEIRIEQPDLEQVREMAAWLGEHKNNPQAILTLYHLNEYDLKTHSKAIENIFSTF